MSQVLGSARSSWANGVVCCGCLFLANSIQAQPATWLSPIDGQWTDPARWSTGTVPDSDSQSAVLGDLGASYTVELADYVVLDALSVIGDGTIFRFVDGRLQIGDQFVVDAGTLLLGAGGGVGNGPLIVGSSSAGGQEPREALRAINGGSLVVVEQAAATLSALALDADLHVQTGGRARLGHMKIGAGSSIIVDPGAELSLIGAFDNHGLLRATDATVNIGDSTSTYTFDQIGTVSFTNVETLVEGTMENAGATATLAGNTGSWTLGRTANVHGGTLKTTEGARWIAAGEDSGSPLFGPHLTDVTLDGVLEVRPGTLLRVHDSLTVTAGSQLVIGGETYTYGVVESVGPSVTIDGEGEIILAGASASAAMLRPYFKSFGSVMELVIGPDITVRTGEGSGTVGNTSSSGWTGSIVNQGLLAAVTPGEQLHVGFAYGRDDQQFTNQGRMRVSNESLLRLQGNWANTGTIQLESGTLELGGGFTTADLGGIERDDGELLITGHWNNVGGDVDLDSALGSVRVNNIYTQTGIEGGRIASSSGSHRLYTESGDGAVLSDVTLAAPLYVASGSSATFRGTVTLENVDVEVGRGMMGESELELSGTLTGEGTVLLNSTPAATPTTSQLRLIADSTIGQDVTVHLRDAGLETTGTHGLTNAGSFIVDGQRLTFGAEGSLVNTGSIVAHAGSRLELLGNWSNTGSVSTVDSDVVLGGRFRLSDLTTNWSRVGGHYTLAGEIDLQGQNFVIGSVLGAWQINGGGFANGRVEVASPADVDWAPDSQLRLRDVTVDRSFDLMVTEGRALGVTGTVRIQSDVHLAGGVVAGEHVFIDGGTFRFTAGDLDVAHFTGDVISEGGRILVGTNRPTTITGNLDMSSASTLVVASALDNSPALRITGNAAIDGTLDLQQLSMSRWPFDFFNGGLRPIAVVESETRVGIFDRVLGAPSGPVYRWAVTYTDQTVDVRPAVRGDINLDRHRDLEDFAAWREGFVDDAQDQWITGDMTGDGVADVHDFFDWYSFADPGIIAPESLSGPVEAVYDATTGLLRLTAGDLPVVAIVLESTEAEEVWNPNTTWLMRRLGNSYQWVDEELAGRAMSEFIIGRFAKGLRADAFGNIFWAAGGDVHQVAVTVVPEPAALTLLVMMALSRATRRPRR